MAAKGLLWMFSVRVRRESGWNERFLLGRRGYFTPRIRVLIVSRAAGAFCCRLRLEQDQEMKPTGSKFYKALYSEYAKVGDREAKEDDWNNAVEYADRDVKSASGGPVYPEAIEARDLPKDAANAQGKFFDCRMEEPTAEGYRPMRRRRWQRRTANAKHTIGASRSTSCGRRGDDDAMRDRSDRSRPRLALMLAPGGAVPLDLN